MAEVIYHDLPEGDLGWLYVKTVFNKDGTSQTALSPVKELLAWLTANLEHSFGVVALVREGDVVRQPKIGFSTEEDAQLYRMKWL